jgi:hypothetical protein
MVRTTPRPVPTETQTLKPLLRYCPTCGETLWAAYPNDRTITTLTAVLGLTLQIRRCLNPACPQWRQLYRPKKKSPWHGPAAGGGRCPRRPGQACARAGGPTLGAGTSGRRVAGSRRTQAGGTA